ncbi:hypothetical protein ACFWIO_21575 [Streptomyces diastatochromogenes]|uniref:hypothetical protein n=1 Tax=Streptomyces diastatochromogenes TaxID=42236 RepID=UPI0036484264
MIGYDCEHAIMRNPEFIRFGTTPHRGLGGSGRGIARAWSAIDPATEPAQLAWLLERLAEREGSR